MSTPRVVAILATIIGISFSVPCLASGPASLAVRVAGRITTLVMPGTHITVSLPVLPQSARPYCLGLESTVDRLGLPVTIAQVDSASRTHGRVVAVIPARILPAEPAGPFLLFVGTCTAVAPDRPIVAQTIIRIVAAATHPRA